MEHGSAHPRYYNYGGQGQFTWGVEWTERGQSDIKFRFDYIQPGTGFVSTWISDITFRIDSLTMDGVAVTFVRFCEIPDITYQGRRLLANGGTRLVEMTQKVVLERED